MTSIAVLPTIPVHDVSHAFPLETLIKEEARAHHLLDGATARVPRTALRSLDAVSRRWLERWDNAHLAEIDSVARRLNRAGAYFLSVNYEWGCTCRVAPAPDGHSARLVRVLDWRTPGLGRYLIAAKVAGKAGPYVTLTWPGYTGVLQGLAKGRFAAALNQAPMRKAAGFYPLDWAANRARVWQMPHPTPAHLLREAFETAADFQQARDMLTRRPISSPAIFSLAGLAANETCVIERTELNADVRNGAQEAANHWQAHGWAGTPRGNNSPGRAAQMRTTAPHLDATFPWLAPPVLNARTRLVMVADARQGRFVAQGYEASGPATAPLELAV